MATITFVQHLQNMMGDFEKRRQLAAQGANSQLERHRASLVQAQ